MTRPRILVAFALAALCAVPLAHADAQLTIGAGGGVGVGSRGDGRTTAHATLFAELFVPLLPGLRADAIVIDAPSGVGPLNVVVSAVFAAPIPVVRPYVLAGWGTYGIGDGSTRGGWNLGVGVRASLGLSAFAEYRRHQRIARDLFTIGLTF